MFLLSKTPFLLVLALAATILSAAADAPLAPSKPIELIGTHGKFDFIKVDATRRRLLACHTGNGSLDVIDLDKSQLIKSIPTGNAQGVAIDEKGGRYFVSCSKPPQLTIVDANTLAVTGTVPLPNPADLCAFDGGNRVFVDNDEKPQMWIIALDQKNIVETGNIEGAGMEDIVFDGKVQLVQAVKQTSMIMVIPTNFFDVEHLSKMLLLKWSTLPAEKPHGLALTEGDNVLVAGGTGKLALIDYHKGQVVASCDIAPKVDEIAYDSGLGRAYSASGTGVISITFVGPTSLSSLGNVPSAPGAHSIAVDPKTHTVWIAYARDSTPYVQSFSAK